MTVPSTTNRNDYTGNGAADTFDYTFRIFAEGDLLVTVRDLAGTETTLELGTDYTVDGVGSYSGGSITLTAGALTSDHEITIRRVVDLLQETDIRNQGAFFPEIHEDVFDLLMMICQQQQDVLDRALRLSETDYGAAATNLPSPAGNQVIGWNSDGDALVNISSSDLATIASAGNFKLDRFEDGTDFTAGTSTVLNLSQNPGTINNTQVFFDGVYQSKDGYSISGNTLTFDSAIPGGTSVVEIVQAGALEVSFPADDSVRTAALQNLAVNAAKLAAKAVENAKIDDDAVNARTIDGSDKAAIRIVLGILSDAITAADDGIGGTVKLVDISGSPALPAVRGDNMTDIPVAAVTGAQKALKVMIVEDRKTSGTGGGTPGSDTTWLVRDLNNAATNDISGASLSSNQITLPAGTYMVRASAPAFRSQGHRIRLRTTGGSTLLTGTSEWSGSGGNYAQTHSHAGGIVTLASSTVFELQHWFEFVGVSTTFGQPVSTGDEELYGRVEVIKIA